MTVLPFSARLLLTAPMGLLSVTAATLTVVASSVWLNIRLGVASVPLAPPGAGLDAPTANGVASTGVGAGAGAEAGVEPPPPPQALNSRVTMDRMGKDEWRKIILSKNDFLKELL
ncbi:hypothetical protein RugamoR57_27530 [Duganella caerulea]